MQRRTAHRLGTQSLLRPDDLLGSDAVQVPVSVRSAPSIGVGDSIDVYAVVGSRTVLVGRRLIVAATGNPLTLVVSASDEPYWIALQANNVSLFAAKSRGVGVPSLRIPMTGESSTHTWRAQNRTASPRASASKRTRERNVFTRSVPP